MGVKLPSGWRDWCNQARLRPHTSAGNRAKMARSTKGWLYLKGRGYVWRVNCYGFFERGDTHAEFDRWALCDIDGVRMPIDAVSFKRAVERLLVMAGQE